MADTLNIPIILGTNRKGRQSEKVAHYLHETMQSHERINTVMFDVANVTLPTEDYGTVLKDQYPEYKKAIIECDGLVIVSPEYNHGYPGSLKTFLDILLEEYIHKAVGLVGVSAGPWGGVRVVESMVPMVRELGLAVTFTDLNFPFVSKAFDENGAPTDEKTDARVADFLNELLWMSETLKWGRENVSSKFHK